MKMKIKAQNIRLTDKHEFLDLVKGKKTKVVFYADNDSYNGWRYLKNGNPVNKQDKLAIHRFINDYRNQKVADEAIKVFKTIETPPRDKKGRFTKS